MPFFELYQGQQKPAIFLVSCQGGSFGALTGNKKYGKLVRP